MRPWSSFSSQVNRVELWVCNTNTTEDWTNKVEILGKFTELWIATMLWRHGVINFDNCGGLIKALLRSVFRADYPFPLIWNSDLNCLLQSNSRLLPSSLDMNSLFFRRALEPIETSQTRALKRGQDHSRIFPNAVPEFKYIWMALFLKHRDTVVGPLPVSGHYMQTTPLLTPSAPPQMAFCN